MLIYDFFSSLKLNVCACIKKGFKMSGKFFVVMVCTVKYVPTSKSSIQLVISRYNMET